MINLFVYICSRLQQLIDALVREHICNIIIILGHAEPDDINAPYSKDDGRTALHIAAALGNVVFVQLLLWVGGTHECHYSLQTSTKVWIENLIFRVPTRSGNGEKVRNFVLDSWSFYTVLDSFYSICNHSVQMLKL